MKGVEGIVFKLGLTVDVGLKAGVTKLVVTVEVTVCVVCFEVMVNDVENLVGGCETMDTDDGGVNVLADVESGWLVVQSVRSGWIVEVMLDVP